MSKDIEIPTEVMKYLENILCEMPFDKILTLFLKGACRHTRIPHSRLELEAVALECVALNTYKFKFRIVQECPDDRGSWTVVRNIEVLAVAAAVWAQMAGNLR